MVPINKYPYTDLHEMNLDYLLQEMTKLHSTIAHILEIIKELGPATKGRRYIMMSDSYGDYLNSQGNNFFTQALLNVGVTDFYDIHLGGSGFVRPAPRNFLDLLIQNEGTITNKETITDIFVLSGANDQIYPHQIEGRIEAFMAYVKTHYPNATVHIGCFTRAWEPDIIMNVKQTYAAYEKCVLYGAKYIANSQYIMMNIEDFNLDNVHPSQVGIDKLTRYLEAYLVNGYFDVDEVATLTFENGTKGVISVDSVEQRQHNAHITFVPTSAGSALTFTFSTSTSCAVGETLITDVFKVTKGFLVSDDTNNLCVHGILKDGSFWSIANMYIATAQMGLDFGVGFVVYSGSAHTFSTPVFIAAEQTVKPF